jgi:hypothetical protein
MPESQHKMVGDVFSDEYEILTPSGFVAFDGIRKHQKSIGITLHLSSGQKFNCTKSHVLITNDAEEIHAMDSIGREIMSRDGCSTVMSITENEISEHYYDILNIHNDAHTFISSGLVSHNCDFIGSMSTLIDNNFLKTLLPVEPLVIPRLPEYVQVWELPKNQALMEQKNWEYVASLDASYGIRADSSVLKIYLVKSNITLHLVAQMSCNDMEIEDFCEQANTLLQKYNQPNLIIEMNGPGTAAMQFFHSKVEYENLLHFDPKGRMMGLWAGDKLKNAAVIMLKSYVQRKLIKDFDADTIAELYSFGKVSKEKWGAMSGNHDDHVMSMLWCIYYVNSPLFYGNIAEVNIAGMKNPDLILETDDSRKEEEDVISNMANPDFHTKELSDAAEHNPYDRDSDTPDKKERIGSGIRIYGEDDDEEDEYNESDDSYIGGFRA